MAVSENSVREGFATVLGAINGLNAYAYWPDTFIPPGVIVLPVETDEELTLGSSVTKAVTQMDFELLVAVRLVSGLVEAEKALGEYAAPHGASSIRAALAADRTLGGLVHTAIPLRWDRPDNEPIGDKLFLGRRLSVRVWAE